MENWKRGSIFGADLPYLMPLALLVFEIRKIIIYRNTNNVVTEFICIFCFMNSLWTDAN